MTSLPVASRASESAAPGPVQRDDESTDKLATLRADLKAAGWSAEVVRMSDADRAEMIRDYGIEG